MRRLLTYTLCLMIVCSVVYGRNHGRKKTYDGPPRSEAELVGRVLNCLEYNDTITYDGLFPTFDTVWKKIMYYTATDQRSQEEINQIRQKPRTVQQFDPYYNHNINKGFMYVHLKGRDSGLHWHDIVLSRYELQKRRLTKYLVGYELIAPVRYMGYVFVEDLLTRKHYCIAMNNLQVIGNYWYGGEVLNIFEANSVDEYVTKEMEERRWKQLVKDYGLKALMTAKNKKQDAQEKENKPKQPLLQDTEPEGIPVSQYMPKEDKKAMDDDDDDDHMPKQVAERKYYVGTFDNNIKVKLYVRYLKGPCPGGICGWQAIYKFGDQPQYIKLDVEKKPDSTWEFTEDPPIGVMDLKLKNKVYTGNWMSTDNETGYDVKLTEETLTTKKAKLLDEIIEDELWANGLQQPADPDDGSARDEGY